MTNVGTNICHKILESQYYIPYPIDSDFIHKEPGKQVVNSANKLQKDRSIPILVVNTTHRTVNVSRNTNIGKIENMDQNVKETNFVLKSQNLKTNFESERYRGSR